MDFADAAMQFVRSAESGFPWVENPCAVHAAFADLIDRLTSPATVHGFLRGGWRACP